MSKNIETTFTQDDDPLEVAKKLVSDWWATAERDSCDHEARMERLAYCIATIFRDTLLQMPADAATFFLQKNPDGSILMKLGGDLIDLAALIRWAAMKNEDVKKVVLSAVMSLPGVVGVPVDMKKVKDQ